jgi:3-deoxy-D-manno-octulosonic-acid transferase
VLAAELGGPPRRALGEDPPQVGGLWLGDTMGELGLYYRLADAVFVGKSLVGEGGQNPLEPARLARPVAVGPYTANFGEAVAALATAGALDVVADADALARWVAALLADPARAAAMGEAGRRAAGAAATLAADIAAMLLELADARA